MAYYYIDYSNSIQVGSGDAFHPTTAGEHSAILVEYGGYLTVDGDGKALVLDDAFWDVTVNGTVGVFGSLGGAGIFIFHAGTGDVSHITVGVTGQVFGPNWGVYSVHPTNIANQGSIGAANTEIGIEELGGGNVTIVNSGAIYGTDRGIEIAATSGVWAISNSGTIHADPGGFAIHATVGMQHVVNTGFIDGAISLGDLDDSFANQEAGQVNGIIDLGAGNDIFTGGDLLDIVRDGGGGDTVDLGGGIDRYVAVKKDASADGTDTVNGGAGGDDFYTAEDATASVHINLGNVAYFLGPLTTMAANTATGKQIGTDLISGFESALGGHGNDLIFGSSAANDLYGNSGSDTLLGVGGADYLYGEIGNDILRGGLGKDTLIGGSNADRFVFGSLAESVVGVNRDVVIDFSHAQFDMIDVHLIDADSNLNGDQSFQFIGAGAFSHAAGELRYAGHVLSGDVDGDGIADFSLHVNAASLLAADFVL